MQAHPSRKRGNIISLDRRGRVGAAVALALAVTAVAVGASAIVRSGGGGSGGAPPREPTAESGHVRADPATVPTVPTDPAAVPATVPPAPDPAAGAGDAGSRIEFAGATFELPEGWTVVNRDVRHWIELDPAAADGIEHPYDYLCVGPADASACALQLWHGDLPGSEGFRAWEDHGDWPWHQSTDPPACPDESGAPGYTDFGAPVDGDLGPVDRGFAPVGDHTAVYDRWEVSCGISGVRYWPQTWHLPGSQIVIVDLYGWDQTDGVLQTFRFAAG